MSVFACKPAKLYRRAGLWGMAAAGALALAHWAAALLHLEGAAAKIPLLLALVLLFPLMKSMEIAEAAAGYHSPARGRFNRRAMVVGSVYVILVIVAKFVSEHVGPHSAILWPVAILAASPIVALIWTMNRYLAEEDDGFLRESFVRMALFGGGLLIAVASCWGFLATFGLAAPFDGTMALVIWALGAIAADLWYRKRGA